jgi:AcrR family transcriptional regulator
VTPPTRSLRERAERYSPAQLRTVAAALDLFADHGFGGTSLQMIADSLGVTKAAVYHQFRTKEAIAAAVMEVELAQLEGAIEDAEADGTDEAREVLLEQVVESAVHRRRAVGTLQNDPFLVRFLNDDEPARMLWVRLFALLLNDPRDQQARVNAAVLSAAIGSVAHPFVADLDNETLRTELLRATRGIIDMG